MILSLFLGPDTEPGEIVMTNFLCCWFYGDKDCCENEKPKLRLQSNEMVTNQGMYTSLYDTQLIKRSRVRNNCCHVGLYYAWLLDHQYSIGVVLHTHIFWT